jgi:hypothetical protein
MLQVPSSGRHVRARRSPIIIIRAGSGLIFRGLDVEVANQARPPLRPVFAKSESQTDIRAPARARMSGLSPLEEKGRSRKRRCPDVADARARAYAAIDMIDWPGGFYRRDIGWRAFARDPVQLDRITGGPV